MKTKRTLLAIGAGAMLIAGGVPAAWARDAGRSTGAREPHRTMEHQQSRAAPDQATRESRGARGQAAERQSRGRAEVREPARGSQAGHRATEARRPAVRSRVVHRAEVPRVVRALPSSRTRVRVGHDQYWYAAGRFYRPVTNGYLWVRAPIGARIHRLPVGAIIIRVGPTPYFFFDGVYYIHDVEQDDYVVTEQPGGADAFDTVVFTDGTSLTGHFTGGDEKTIDIEVGNEIYRIDRSEVASITLAAGSE